MAAINEDIDYLDVGGNDVSARWWKQDDARAHESLFAVAHRIYDEDETRRTTLEHHIRLYGARDLLSSAEPEFLAAMLPSNRLRYNAVQAVTETAVSRLGKNKPKAAFVTNAAGWSLQKQTRLLEKYVEGTFYAEDVYSKGRRAFRDGCVSGTGVLHFFPRKVAKNKWRVGIERVQSWQILVDRHDGWDGSPRQMFRVHYVDRETLFAKYCETDRWKGRERELRQVIDEAAAAKLDTFNSDNRVNRVEVIEGWRLPSAPEAGDGKHTVAVSSGVLDCAEWTDDWFPFAIYRWQPPLYGFWGSGIAEAINGVQVNINRLLRVMEKAYQLFASPWTILPRGARVDKSKITNKIGQTIEYDGNLPPQVITHNPVSQQFIGHLQQLKQDAFDLSGVSALSARGEKPADLESGAALRQYNAIEDARHADPALNYEAFYMQTALIIVRMSRMMNRAGMPTEVQGHYRRRWRKWIRPIDWGSMPDITEDNVALAVTPTSILPTLPAGRTATIQQWLAAGFIDPPTAQYLLEIPDLDAFPSPNVAMLESILDDIETILDEEKPRLPEPYQDLALTRQLGTSSYLRARMDGAPESALELLRVYIDGADRLQKREEQQMLAAQGNPGATAPAQNGGIPPQFQAGPGLAELQQGMIG